MALFTAAIVSACGGSHGSSLPEIPAGGLGALNANAVAIAPAAGVDIVAINAGGGATGSFSADKDYTVAGTAVNGTASAINTSGVANPPPQAVFADERYGKTVTYAIPGLTPGAGYTVRLDFAELYWTAAGQRVFNVTINGARVLTNFDLVKTTGARFKAVVESFGTTASSTGTITISETAVTDNATIQGIEVAAGGTSTPPPGGSVAINSGGGASGRFAADADYVAAGTAASTHAHTVDVSGVTDPPPQAVLADIRYGPSVAYTIPGLTAGADYTVRLDFAELYFSSSGKRAFNVSINGTNVLSNFDIFAAAGTSNKAVAKSFGVKATANGTIAITFSAVINEAAVNAIEITPVTGGPSPSPSPSFNDYATFGYDNARDVYNPNTTAISSKTLGNVHLAWQAALNGGDYNTQTQPVLATGLAGHKGVLFVGGGSGNVYGYDALTGKAIWKRFIGQETYICENNYTAYFGVGGTAAYDAASKSLYVVGNTNPSPDAVAQNLLFHLDGATGAVLGKVNFAPATAGWPSLDFSHTAVTLGANGLAYVGTGATCDISSWRGRVAAVSVPAMTLAKTFYTVWNGTSQPWGGGGVWGWGGVSLDSSGNVLTGVGNTDDGGTTHGKIVAPFKPSPHEYSGLGEALVKLSPTLANVVAGAHPIPLSIYGGNSGDLDLAGTPAVFTPNGAGCGQMAAAQAKSGTLYLFNLAGGVALRQQYALAPSSYMDSFLGQPTYSPATGLLYAAIPSSQGSLYPPGMIAINPGCGTPSVTWHSAFGPDTGSAGIPRGVPAVSAGGLVFVGTDCYPDGNGGCSGDVKNSLGTTAQSAQRKPAICCAPPGSEGGALWVLDASTGEVLNGGLPLITTGGPIRMPATLDGSWIFVLDNSGNMYGLTIDSSIAAIAQTARIPDARMLRVWEGPPRP